MVKTTSVKQPFLLVGLLLLLFSHSTTPLNANTAVSPPHLQTPTINRNQATVNFPDEVIFQLDIAPDFVVDKAVLTYDLNKFTCLDATATVPLEVTGNNLEWTWILSRSGNPPPGAELWWEWTITDSSGSSFTTPRQTLTFSDDRFQWDSIEQEGVRLHWYGNDQTGPILLQAAVAGLDRLQTEMGIELEDEVQLYIYDDYDDMRAALLFVQDWAGAVAFDEYNIILMGVPPDIANTWGVQTVPHELAHLVLGRFGHSCVGGHRPTWLEEGLAVYAEGEPQADMVRDLENGVKNNSFEPLRSLTGAFSAHGTEAGIAYSQSYSTITFMLNTYGQEKMQQLILRLADGTGYDEALTAVYGFNMDGLELAWREAMGLPPRAIPATPTPFSAAAIPTFEPLSAPASLPTPPAADQPPPAAPEPSITVCGLGAMPLALVGLWFGSRKRKGNNEFEKKRI
jgi:hypothetical protein